MMNPLSNLLRQVRVRNIPRIAFRHSPTSRLRWQRGASQCNAGIFSSHFPTDTKSTGRNVVGYGKLLLTVVSTAQSTLINSMIMMVAY